MGSRRAGSPRRSDREMKRPRIDHPIALHRDWVSARHAMIRATGLMLLLGAIWVVTGWAAGPYLLLGTAVMATLFSTWENPGRIMTAVLIGQVFGGIAALACRWLVWPHATGEAELIFMIMPFILSGVLPLSHPRTMASATDYCMILLLLLQPVFSGSSAGRRRQARGSLRRRRRASPCTPSGWPCFTCSDCDRRRTCHLVWSAFRCRP